MTRAVNREPSSHNWVVDFPALSENRRVSSCIRKRNVRIVTHKCIMCMHIHLNGHINMLRGRCNDVTACVCGLERTGSP